MVAERRQTQSRAGERVAELSSASALRFAHGGKAQTACRANETMGHITSQSTGPGLALLAPAGDRESSPSAARLLRPRHCCRARPRG